MAKSTHPITYVYAIDHEGAEHEITVTRRHVGTAYARNGNVHNPTEYFTWSAALDGETVGTGYDSRATAYEYARAQLLGIPYYWHPNYPNRARNVRSYVLVQDEMRANYRRRIQETQ